MFHSLLFPRARAYVQSNSQTDVYDVGDHYLLQVNAVGFLKEDLDISATHNSITIEGNTERVLPKGYTSISPNQRTKNHLQRSFRFRETLETEAIEAQMENGLLNIKIPKKSAQKIDIQVV